MDPIQYLNTDLELLSSRELGDLAFALQCGGLMPLAFVRSDSDKWFATFESGEQFEEAETNIAALLEIIEKLDPTMKEVWDACSRRHLNIGYRCGEGPIVTQKLPTEILARAATLGLSLLLTLYPADAEARYTVHEKSPLH